MKKHVDYTQLKAERDQWLLERSTQRADIAAMIEDLMDSERARHDRPINEARKTRVTEDYYNVLCSLAWVNGGRVELDWNEACPIAALTYFGKELTLDKDFSPERENLSLILGDCDTVNFSAEGNIFKLVMTFDLRASASA